MMERIIKIDILSILIFLPLFLSIPVFFIGEERRKWLWGYGFSVSLMEFILSLFLLFSFRSGETGFQFVVNSPWIPQIGARYHIGIDGLSLLLILLTTLLTSVGILSSFNYISHRVREYLIAMLLMETGMVGVFASLDLLLFFIFWEAMLVPMYFLIGLWGHERRIYAAYKFIIYTMAGSAFLLLGILVLYFYQHKITGDYTFDLLRLMNLPLPLGLEKFLFMAFAVAFAIKIPLFPFHTWLPDAHVEAPTAGSVLLAGILLKMGIYGFLRFAFPLFPNASLLYTPLFIILGLIGIIYGAWMAWVQEDLKKLIAYSSIAHLGFVTIGVFARNIYGLQGGILQMVNHGISTGALFLIAGLLYERRHTRYISEFGGLGKVMPLFATIFGIVMLSSIGLPGLNNFIGEFLCLLGVFKVKIGYAVLGVIGVILAAVYMLSMFQRVVFSSIHKEENRFLPDLSFREFLVFLPLLILIFFIGIYPKPFLKISEPVSKSLVVEKVLEMEK
jgi:NADH-quinone oxidoreductase subunit M